MEPAEPMLGALANPLPDDLIVSFLDPAEPRLAA